MASNVDLPKVISTEKRTDENNFGKRQQIAGMFQKLIKSQKDVEKLLELEGFPTLLGTKFLLHEQDAIIRKRSAACIANITSLENTKVHGVLREQKVGEALVKYIELYGSLEKSSSNGDDDDAESSLQALQYACLALLNFVLVDMNRQYVSAHMRYCLSVILKSLQALAFDDTLEVNFESIQSDILYNLIIALSSLALDDVLCEHMCRESISSIRVACDILLKRDQKSVNNELLEACTALLWNNALNEFCREDVATYGGKELVERLVDISKSNSDSKVRTNASNVLQILSTTEVSQRHLLGDVNLLIAGLKEDDAEEVTNAAGTIWNLAKSAETRKKIEEYNGPTLLLERLKYFVDRSALTVVYKVTGALSTLTLTDSISSNLGKLGAIDLLFDQLQNGKFDKDFMIVENMLSVLNNMAVLEDNRNIMRTIPRVSFLTSFLVIGKNEMTEEKFSLAEKAANCLTSISVDDVGSRMIRDVGGIEKLINLVRMQELKLQEKWDNDQAFSEYDMAHVRKRASTVLWNLSLDDENLKMIEDLDGIKPLVSLLPQTELDDKIFLNNVKKQDEADAKLEASDPEAFIVEDESFDEFTYVETVVEDSDDEETEEEIDQPLEIKNITIQDGRPVIEINEIQEIPDQEAKVVEDVPKMQDPTEPVVDKIVEEATKNVQPIQPVVPVVAELKEKQIEEIKEQPIAVEAEPPKPVEKLIEPVKPLQPVMNSVPVKQEPEPQPVQQIPLVQPVEKPVESVRPLQPVVSTPVKQEPVSEPKPVQQQLPVVQSVAPVVKKEEKRQVSFDAPAIDQEKKNRESVALTAKYLKQKKRWNHIRLLYESEQEYNNLLAWMDVNFMASDSYIMKHRMIDDQSHSDIFQDIDCLRLVNIDFFHEIERINEQYQDCFSDKEDQILIGSIMIKRSPTLRLYKTYANNLKRAIDSLSSQLEKRHEFREFIAKNEQNIRQRSLRLDELSKMLLFNSEQSSKPKEPSKDTPVEALLQDVLLKKPVERVNFYTLWLEEMINVHTRFDHPDFKLLKEAHKQLSLINDYCVKKLQQLEQLEQFAKMLQEHPFSQKQKKYYLLKNLGFPEPTELQSYNVWSRKYDKLLAQSYKAWSNYKGVIDVKSSTVKTLIKKYGIVPLMRPRVWLSLSGAQKKMEENQGYYQKILQASSKSITSKVVKEIEKDVKRTYPSHPFFSDESSPVFSAMRRLFIAYSTRNPLVNYSQSFNFIAGLLLLHLSEEEAFWLFVSIIEDYLPQNFYSPNLKGVLVDASLLDELIYQNHSKLASHFKKLGFEVSTFTMAFLMKLYSADFPVETTLRIWDAMFLHGGVVLFKVALALLKMNESALLKAPDLSSMLLCFQNMVVKPCFDCDKLLKTASNYDKKVTPLKIEQLRKRYSALVEVELKKQEALRN